jgi:hypothetical protein
VVGSRVAVAEPTWEFKAEFWPELVREVPQILKSQDKTTGRFGTGIWIVTDQNVMFPLAVAWALPHPENPYYQQENLLQAIMDAGDALIDDQDDRGQWEFRKKDGSTWGKIYMPWIYSRWIRSFALIRQAMPQERRVRWENALTLGYTGIANSALRHVHNIPAHHAMGLFCAGQVLNRPAWCDQARQFMAKVCATQDSGGYWSEHQGPVVGYNLVYTDALGTYFAMSQDEGVLPALQRAAEFHAAFTYPDGSRVETVDERNPYKSGVSLGTVGFTFSPLGRQFLKQQLQQTQADGKHVSADAAASMILYGREGPCGNGGLPSSFVLGDGDAMIARHEPWFLCLSAFCCEVPKSRWIQDRQSFCSLFHQQVGLIVGGGNTKLQPGWSTFCVGDASLLAHRPGDTHPDFRPPGRLWHVPDRVTLDVENQQLDLRYGEQECRLVADTSDPKQVRLTLTAVNRTDHPVRANLTLLPHVGEAWTTESGEGDVLAETPINLTARQTGSWFAHHGWRISVPPTASIRWPVLPHNPYRKDGRASAGEGRIVLSIPFSSDQREATVIVDVP